MIRTPSHYLSKVLWRLFFSHWCAFLLKLVLGATLCVSALWALHFLPYSIAHPALLLLTFLMGTLIIFLTIRESIRWRRRGNSVGILEEHFPILRSDVTTWMEWKKFSRLSEEGYSLAMLSGLESSLEWRIENLPWQSLYGFRMFLRRNRGMLFAIFCVLTLLARENVWEDLPVSYRDSTREAIVEKGTSFLPFRTDHLLVQLRYPGYSKRPPTGLSPLGPNLEALKGTIVHVEFQVDPKLASVGVLLPNQEYVPAQNQNERYAVEWMLRDSGDLFFQGKDAEGKLRRDPIRRNLKVIADESPHVVLSRPTEETMVDPNSEVAFVYGAEDDFGLSAVRLDLKGDRFSRSIALAKPDGKTFNGEFILRIGQLAVPSSERAISAEIVATDGDEISGPKEGKSSSVLLRLRNSEEARKERIIAIQKWKEILVHILGNDLENKGSWEGDRQALISLSQTIAREMAATPKTSGGLKGIQENVAEMVEARNAVATPPPEGQKWNGLEEEIRSLEKSILLLERVESRERMENVANASDRLSDASDRLSDLLNKSNLNSDDLKKALAETKSAMEELARALAEASRRGIEDYVNREAFEGKDLRSSTEELAEIERLLREGKNDEAKARLEKYARRLQEMASQFRKNASNVAKSGDEKLRKEFQALRNDLRNLKTLEEKLANDTSALRDRSEGESDPQSLKKNSELLSKVKELRRLLREARAESHREKTEPWGTMTRDRIPRAEEGARRLDDEIQKAQRSIAESEARKLEQTIGLLVGQGESLQGTFRRTFPLRSPNALNGLPNLAKAEVKIREIREFLSNAQEEAREHPLSPVEKQELAKLREKQNQISQRMKELDQRMREFDRRMGMLGAGSNKKLSEAGEHMKSASEKLGEGKPSPAVGHERDAVASMEGLEEQMDSAASEMQSSMMESNPGSSSGAVGRMSSEPVLLPEPGKERRNESWWKAIMEAMKEKPPEGYEEETKRYFMELSE